MRLRQISRIFFLPVMTGLYFRGFFFFDDVVTLYFTLLLVTGIGLFVCARFFFFDTRVTHLNAYGIHNSVFQFASGQDLIFIHFAAT